MRVQQTFASAIESSTKDGLPIYGMLAQRTHSDKLVCFMPAAQSGTGTRRYKLFSRWSWQTEMLNQHVIALSDPALGLDKEIRGAWYLHPTDDLMLDMAEFVSNQITALGLTNNSVLFYGSSLGGFGALGMASLLPGACAIAEIPQIDIARWPSPGSVKAMETKILGKSFSEYRVAHPEMVDVRDRFKKSGVIPPFALITNPTDMSIDVQQEFMDDVILSNLPKIGDQQLLLTEHISGHHALDRSEALKIISLWGDDGDLRNVSSVNFEHSAPNID